jgi:sarcosine oxidase subunit gamma
MSSVNAMAVPFLRTSPARDAQRAVNAQWSTQESMEVVERFDRDDHDRARTLGIADLSYQRRMGVKGRGAAAWLVEQGVLAPDAPNTWQPLPEGGFIARLGLTEYLIEDGFTGRISARLAHVEPGVRVYPVLRQDLALGLCGEALYELLLQTCNVNFRALDLQTRPVVLTSMAGVAITVLPGERLGLPYYRVWADGTYGTYMWTTLAGIAAELGGGPVGLATIAAIDQAPRGGDSE